MRFSTLRVSLAAASLCALASTAHSQWTVTYLHPAGAISSYGFGVSGVDEVGQELVGTNSHAARWTGSAASFVDLNPVGAVASELSGTDGVHQVGDATLGPTPGSSFLPKHAAIWSGTPASFVDLHPSGHSQTSGSNALSVQGNLQVGYLDEGVNLPTFASSWNSTATSYANIEASSSTAYGTDGVSIVGSSTRAGGNHAALWKFGPASFTDLNPVNSTSSEARGVDGNLQVGDADIGGSSHAAIWKGTAASFVDLNPSGASSSQLNGVDGGFEVGLIELANHDVNAGIWSGTPGSFVNLQPFLAPGYFFSQATAIWTDGTTIRVVGWARNGNLNRFEAILWTRTVPEPACLPMIAAIFSAATLRCRWPRTLRLRRNSV